MTFPQSAIVRPAALRPGATPAVLSAAGTPKPGLVHRGMSRLQELGYMRMPTRSSMLRFRCSEVIILSSGGFGSLCQKLPQAIVHSVASAERA